MLVLRRIVSKYRFLFCCRLAGRSFAYMWGVGLRADLKFNLANLARHKKKVKNEEKFKHSEQRRVSVQRPAFKQKYPH